MNKIISCLDEYMIKNGRRELNPVEANEILNRAGLLKDSASRPGKPLRDLLRNGQLPHAYQTGGKGSSWIIPRSVDRSQKSVTAQVKRREDSGDARKPEMANTEINPSIDIEVDLMAKKNFKVAAVIDNLIPSEPGFYCIRIADATRLPVPFCDHSSAKGHDIIYIGIAEKSLNRRLLKQELRANGHGTFFRSLGALLGFRPEPGSLSDKANKRNYKFSKADERQIIKWINKNLLVSWVLYDGEFKSLERSLIRKYSPLLNIANNPSVIKELSVLRAECVSIASSLCEDK